MSTPPIPTLPELNEKGRAIVLEYYGAGYAAGLVDGRAREAEVYRQEWAALGDLCRDLAKREPYADLAERRGQHDRAEAQRTLLRERGIS